MTTRLVAPVGSAHAAPPPSGRLQPGTKVQVGKYVVQIEKFLSEGGFAHVYVASLVSPSNVEGFPASENRFVLKRMAVPDKAGLVEVRKEVDVMKQLRPHKHIVYFIEASASSIPGSSGYEIFILMEWCPGGGIIDLLNSRLQNRLTESEILKIFSDTVEAVAHMHSQEPILIHRDLKVENILVASPNLYKLCDFGSTTSPLPRPPQTSAEIMSLEADLNKHTTLQYRAPEMVDVWSRKGVTEKADIWALGVFLYKLCYYTTPFEAHGPLAIVNVQYQIPSYPAYSNSIKYLIGTMLQELAQSRPDIWEVHEHVCKLRGITSHLLRPKRKNLTPKRSNSLVVSNPIHPKPSSNTISENRLDSIFTTTPASSAPQIHQKMDTVVPMRRGRPITKTKPIAGIIASNDDSFFESRNSTVPAAPSNVTGKITSPPGESDLFAREAAAGFGDDFLSSSPQFISFKPAVQKAKVTIDTHLPVARPQPPFKPLAPKPQIQHDPKTVALSAFDDLVPSRKKTPPKTLNEIRNNLPSVNSAVTGPTSKLSTHVLSFTNSNMKLPESSQSISIGAAKLLQKTGPQSLPSRVPQTIVYQKISITQRTGPAISSGLPAVMPQAKPSLSHWLEKDQAKLVSRSTQTSPSLLKSLVSELTLGAQLNIFNGNKLATNPSVDVSNGENILQVEPIKVMRTNPGIAHSKPRLQETYSQDQLELNAQPKMVLNPPRSLLTMGISPVGTAGQSNPQADQETSVSSDSDEEPEDPEGQKVYQAQAQATLPINHKIPLKPSAETISSELSRRKTGHAPSLHAENLANGHGLSDGHEPVRSQPSPSTSVTELSSSEAMTEEDEAIKLKRRAAIAKFAPAAKGGDSKADSNQISRDPFSSRARSRSVSPESSQLSTTMVSEHIKRQVAPPLRAPRPQSVKSAAAINNLVSRYDNLSASTSDSPSSIKSPSTAVGVKKRHSIFKPISIASNPTNEKVHNSVIENTNTSLPKSSSVHIPKTFLGPGVVSSTRVEDPVVLTVQEDEEAEERFISVNDMKSKWESGAVQASQYPKDRRLPRTDYGQS